MKRSTRLAAALTSLLLMVGFASPAMSQNDPDMLTILTSGDDETQAMALILTMQAMDNQVDAQILLCDEAGDLAVGELAGDSPVFEGPDASPAQMVQRLIGNGVTVEVCAIYLPNREYTDADLIDGVGIAQPPAIGALVADPDVRLFTF